MIWSYVILIQLHDYLQVMRFRRTTNLPVAVVHSLDVEKHFGRTKRRTEDEGKN